MSDAPDPMRLHPVEGQERVVFLRPLVRDPRIEVGEYTYYDDPDDPLAFEQRAVLYGFGPERLVRSPRPPRVIRNRFGDDDVALLLRAAWWEWPIALVTEHARTIMAGTPDELAQIAAAHGLLADAD